MRLENRVIVVTGATSTVSKAMAEAFVDEGARVVCSAPVEPSLNAVVEDLQGDGEVIGVPANISDTDDVDQLVTTARDTYGPIEVLVNNAVGHRAMDNSDERWRVDEQPVEVWDDVVARTVRGSFLCSRAVLPEMRDRREGRVIHFTSRLGHHGQPKWGPHVSSTHAVEGLHKTIALESEGTGVDSVLFGSPRGGIYMGTNSERTSIDPFVVSEPAVQLAAGVGENGEYYVASEDGKSLVSYDDSDVWYLVNERNQVGPGDTLSWSVDLHPGDELIVESQLIEGTDPVIEVDDSRGEVIANVDGIGLGEMIRREIEIEREGRHNIKFQNEAPLASGQWDIKIGLRDANSTS